MKKFLSCLLVLLVLVMMPALTVEAQAAETSGTCGDNLTWTLTNDGNLHISGTGKMENQPDWYGQENRILSVTMDEGVTYIGESAFAFCYSLTSVTIPNSVTSIGEYAFSGCYDISEVYISDMNVWCKMSFDGSSNPLFYRADLYLNNEKVTDLVLHDGITAIGAYTFYGCTSLTSITIPESVTSIGKSAFMACDNLTKVCVSDLSAWCNVLFADKWSNPLCGRADLYLNDEKVTDLALPYGIATISAHTFYGCTSLTSVTIPDSVTSIGDYAFGECASLTSVTIPEGVTFIGERAFDYCSSLTNVTVPEGVTFIDCGVFNHCTSLSSVTIPGSVTSIGSYAFLGCTSLTDVYYAGTEEQWNAIAVEEDNEDLINATIHYGSPTEEDKPATPPADGNPFVDIALDAYYYTPVQWAVKWGITTGMDATHFAPDGACTRAQIATFLWRLAGSPESASGNNPFADVNSSDYFYRAVLWAYNNKITSGVSNSSFAPNAPCTRGQVATFLWRMFGEPKVNKANVFSDIATGAYYYNAVLWAVEEGITNGIGAGLFAPDATCTRGQIVTFLYRAMEA